MNKKIVFWIILGGFGLLVLSLMAIGCGAAQSGGGGNTGAIAFYSGQPTGVNGSVSNFALIPWPGLKEVHLYIEKIDISPTGASWEAVLTGTREVVITASNTPMPIGDPVTIPAAQYEGVRINILPKITWIISREALPSLEAIPTEEANLKVTLTTTESDAIVTVEATPNIFVSNTIGFWGPSSNQGQTTKAVFSTLNGFLTAFNVEAGATTYLVFEIRPDSMAGGFPSTDPNFFRNRWNFGVVCRATRFIGETATTLPGGMTGFTTTTTTSTPPTT